VALWWNKFGTRVLFSDSPLSFTFLIEQFWGRAARASWIRKNPDARLIFPQNPIPPVMPRFTPPRSCARHEHFDPAAAPAQFVEMVKFTVMRA
jgi:hypothetical protein